MITNKNKKNFNDPFIEVIQNDEIIDSVSEQILNDSIYVENYELFDSGQMSRSDFIEIINQLILKYKNQK